MSRDIHRSWYVTGALMLSLIVPTVAQAQSSWLSSQPGTVSLEALRPSFENETITTFSMAYFLTGRIQLANGMHVIAELPFSHAGMDPGGDVEALGDNTIGNPYVGMEMALKAVPFQPSVEVGVRLPLSTGFGDDGIEDESRLIGASAAFDRAEAFGADLAALSALASVRSDLLPMVTLRVRAGGIYDYYTDVAEGEDSGELFAAYAVQGWSGIASARLGAGVTGRALVTESDVDFADRSWHEVGVWADYAVGSFRPGITLRLPLDDDFASDHILGVSLQYSFGN